MIAAIASFFGMIIRLIYNLVNSNYFLSIILFTILTKIILFPLTLIQMKSMEKMNSIGPEDQRIREKYKNDKNKQAEELTKLYSENKINPMGGCLPLLIQIPIIIAMFYIVKQPLTYIKQMPQEELNNYASTYAHEKLGREEGQTLTEKEIRAYELQIAKEYNLLNMKVTDNFDLGEIPKDVFNKNEDQRSSPIALLIPILTIIVSFASTKLQQNTQTMSEEQIEMSKTNNLMMPLLSGFIAYTMPLALGVYWLLGNIISIIQQLVMKKIIKGKEEKKALNEGGKI